MSSIDPTNPVEAGADDVFLSAFEEFNRAKAPTDQSAQEPSEPEAAQPEAKSPAEEAGDEKPQAAATPEDEAARATPAADPAKTDPFEGLSPELKEKFETLQRERDELDRRWKRSSTNEAQLQSRLAKLSRPAAATPEPDKVEKREDQPDPLEEVITKLEGDFPDIGKALKAIVENQKKELAPVRDAVTGMSERADTDLIAAQIQALDARHPDWRTLAEDSNFKGWQAAQPEAIQRLATSWDANEVSAAIDLFKAQRAGAMEKTQTNPKPAAEEEKGSTAAATDAKRKQQLEGGRAVTSKPASAASGPPDDFESAFEHYVAKQEQKKAAHAIR